jgi:glycosyltransferase involved in cell wall biosynthesis
MIVAEMVPRAANVCRLRHTGARPGSANRAGTGEIEGDAWLRILLIANFLPDEQQSMSRFCDLLAQGLTAHGDFVSVLRPEPFFIRLSRSSVLRKWLGYLDKYLLFPPRLSRGLNGYDFVHICDHSNSMYTHWLRDKPHSVTCHDLMAVRSALGEIPENPTRWTGRILQRSILRGLRRAHTVVCVSRKTQGDLLRLGGRTEARTPCVVNGLNYAYAPMGPDEALRTVEPLLPDPGRPFFVHVGGNSWYKNRIGLLRIFDCLRSRDRFARHRLILAGKPGDAEMHEFLRSRDLGGDVMELRSPSNEELRALYSLAEGLIFPSLEEGFGWPILEAQACGCPVFTSNRAPMTEVGGAAAVYFDPGNPAAACEAIAASLSRREELSFQGIENARRFSSDGMIAAYREIFSAVVKDSGRS